MKFLWRMNRRRPTRRIPNPSDFKAALAAVHITIRNRLEGTLISILVVAEKPSVAMSYAKVLGATSRQDGYLEGNGYLVSWCVGHLVELAPPNVYDAKYVKWSIADLPILPQKWQYLVSTSTKKQFGILQKLMHRPDVESVICATDAGREGELIFRLVYQQAGCKKPFTRLWLSSMEENAIREGFAHLKPSTEYDALYNAALCRERADWMVGINASRLFSCLYGQPLAVGRVMTPVLAMTVVREAAIAAFVPEKFYTVDLELTSGCTASSRRIPEKSVAENLLKACRKEMVATIQRITRKEKTENPPSLYDLTTLQRDANLLLGYSAQQTLDYVQSLYEKKLTTYPRTDSCYITDDDEEMVYDDKKAAGERLLLARQEMPNADMMLLGTYRGFELNIRFDSFKNEHQAVLRAELSYPVSLGDDARGNITRLDNAIDNFADRIADADNALQNLEQQKQAAEVEVAKPFAQEEELAEKSARLAELNALLNIDRDRSSSQDAPEETEETETPATRPSVLAALGEKTNQSETVKPFRSYYDKDGDAR